MRENLSVSNARENQDRSTVEVEQAQEPARSAAEPLLPIRYVVSLRGVLHEVKWADRYWVVAICGRGIGNHNGTGHDPLPHTSICKRCERVATTEPLDLLAALQAGLTRKASA